MKVLLIVDPQNDFITGSLAVPDAESTMQNLVNWYNQHKKELSETFITMDTHPKNHCSFKENGGEWPEHCIDGSQGWMVYKPLLDILENDSYFLKGCNPNHDEYSIFDVRNTEGLNLKEYLKFLKNKYKEIKIYIAGIAGDYCVLNTLKDLVSLGYEKDIIILPDCIASLDKGLALLDFISKNNINNIC